MEVANEVKETVMISVMAEFVQSISQNHHKLVRIANLQASLNANQHTTVYGLERYFQQ
jgi:hypothetical protein